MKKLVDVLESEPFEKYRPTIMPKDTTKLFVEDGNTVSDTVVMFIQGGPIPKLQFTFLNYPELDLLTISKSYKKIYVHQSQTYNSSIANSENEFTFEAAKNEGNVSAEILYRSIDYFKKRNKK